MKREAKPRGFVAIMSRYTIVKGFKDILPGEVEVWQRIENVAWDIFEDFGFSQIRIPVLEKTELFTRSIGTSTDIVEKEMYTFTDRKGESLTLRPEATASIVRAYIEHKLYARDPVFKCYTMGPMFRRERPQRGRYRQFYQINAEVIGLNSPKSDSELILILMTIMKHLSVPGIFLHINSLGCKECRARFKGRLREFLDQVSGSLCPDCFRRREQNPLRIFDCKVPTCQETISEAPSILDFLCSGCHAHFEEVQENLKGFKIPFEVNNRLVRGLDYYTRTTFEAITTELGAQNALAGGGRYNGLVQALGGPDQPGVGFAIGLDRLAALLIPQAKENKKKPRLFIAALGAQAQREGFSWLETLRIDRKIRCEMDFEDHGLKTQMKRADRLGASYVLIVGDRELEERVAVCRNMMTGEQKPVSLKGNIDDIIENICLAIA